MTPKLEPNIASLQAENPQIISRFDALKRRQLSLDMTRGKPCSEQLDLANGLLDVLGRDFRAEDGTDCRNYGGIDGLPEAKHLFAKVLDVQANEILIGDNSSLSLMHSCIAHALSHGVGGGAAPWSSKLPIRVLCPAPGYDRHFALCQHFGIDMIPVEMTEHGPNMDEVGKLVADDPQVKGIWLVPKYSNPTGVCISAPTAERLAKMTPAAKDFRIFWDNAYAIHDLVDDPPTLPNILTLCRRAGCENRPWMFGSTSKVSFAGAGIGFMAASVENLAWIRGHRSKLTIGPDKLNQLRHVRFFKDIDGIRAHMKKHAAILKPKFDAVQRIFERELGDSSLARWTRPLGGYFVSLDTLDDCASRVVSLAAELGVKLTGAGATFPLGHDPRNRNIRIAPTLPSLADIETAMEAVAICVKRASAEKLLSSAI